MNESQVQASDPNYSIWVSASAGTGKTKILTDRVLRLLISGATFDKILCLTFTNAAAAEMQSRILNKLSHWANLSSEMLLAEIHLLIQKTPSEQDLENAKNLYHSLLSTQDKINIHTIHSFCQRLLKQFPLEAGISPAFQVIDNTQEQEILKQVKEQLYLQEEHRIIDFFIANFHETVVEDILAEIIKNCAKFRELKYLELSSEPIHPNKFFDITKILAEICLSNQTADLMTLLEANLGKEINWECIRELCLTKDGNIRKKILNAKDKQANQTLAEYLDHLQRKIYDIDQNYKFEQIIYQSEQLKKLGKLFIELYEHYKKQHSLLDYDDLIFLTKSLLTQKNAREWVLYKLDGGIDHLLVDEAQDTSPQQWLIIESIITEFYSGEGARAEERTLFVVGDEKQSIFSFQGADIESFNLMNAHLREKLKIANKKFAVVNLEWSYRSCAEILEVAYRVFEHIKNIDADLFIANNPKILPFRNTHPGRVELWPLICNEKDTGKFWPLPAEQNQVVSASIKLADNIADFIFEQISKGTILPSTGQKAKEGDFMILFRRRDEFTLEVINQLKKKGLEVAGIDRLTLNQNLSVADLIACAKFVLLPSDDLNLASLLRSPIIDFSEHELQSLSSKRNTEISLWQILELNPLMYHKTLKKLNDLRQLYKVSNVANFFHVVVDCLGLRSSMNFANGPESDDAINELIYLCQDYASRKNNSLQGFIHWFENNEIEIKRDTSSASKIKIMTIHGAKGLQSPVVILCDTTSLPINKSKFIWSDDSDYNGDNNLFIVKDVANMPECLIKLKAKQQKKDIQEYLRLLYVGMTRAEDKLIICGYSNGEKLPENCWYDLVQKSMKQMIAADEDGLLIYENQTKNNFMNDEPCSIIKNRIASNLSHIKEEKTNYKIPELTPDFTINSPLISQDYLKYGQVFHKVLEDSINIKDTGSMKSHPLIAVLTPGWQSKIYQSIDKLHNNEQFHKIVAMNTKTELSIGSSNEQGIDTGRIDLMAMDDNNIIIIDYKSDNNPIYDFDKIPSAYVYQLEFYRKTIQKIYPTHQITCQILWLQTGDFTEILL